MLFRLSRKRTGWPCISSAAIRFDYGNGLGRIVDGLSVGEAEGLEGPTDELQGFARFRLLGRTGMRVPSWERSPATSRLQHRSRCRSRSSRHPGEAGRKRCRSEPAAATRPSSQGTSGRSSAAEGHQPPDDPSPAVDDIGSRDLVGQEHQIVGRQHLCGSAAPPRPIDREPNWCATIKRFSASERMSRSAATVRSGFAWSTSSRGFGRSTSLLAV